MAGITITGLTEEQRQTYSGGVRILLDGADAGFLMGSDRDFPLPAGSHALRLVRTDLSTDTLAEAAFTLKKREQLRWRLTGSAPSEMRLERTDRKYSRWLSILIPAVVILLCIGYECLAHRLKG